MILFSFYANPATVNGTAKRLASSCLDLQYLAMADEFMDYMEQRSVMVTEAAKNRADRVPSRRFGTAFASLS